MSRGLGAIRAIFRPRGRPAVERRPACPCRLSDGDEGERRGMAARCHAAGAARAGAERPCRSRRPLSGCVLSDEPASGTQRSRPSRRKRWLPSSRKGKRSRPRTRRSGPSTSKRQPPLSSNAPTCTSPSFAASRKRTTTIRKSSGQWPTGKATQEVPIEIDSVPEVNYALPSVRGNPDRSVDPHVTWPCSRLAVTRHSRSKSSCAPRVRSLRVVHGNRGMARVTSLG